MKAGWKISKLGEVCTIQPPKSEARQLLRPNDMVSFVPMEALRIQRKEIGATIDRAFSEVQGSYTYFANGDVLLAKITPCFENGKLGIASGLTNGVGFGSSEYIVMRPSACMTADFLYYFLLQDSFREVGAKNMTGTAGQKRVTKTYVESSGIPIPPLKEQERIVAILDEAFEGIATAKANAEKNVQNARALFDSRLGSIFNQKGSSWERITLSSMLERGWIQDHMDGNHGGDYPRKEEFISEGVPYIAANCLFDNQVDLSTAKYLAPDRAAKLRKGFAKDGDVLFAHNATVGPVAILRTSEPVVILGTSLTYYRCNPARLIPEYLAHYMRSHSFRVQYKSVMSQMTRNQVPITKQREFYHVVPPLAEQEAIAKELEQLSDDADRLTRVYEQKKDSLDNLKQSLLHQAFTGKL